MRRRRAASLRASRRCPRRGATTRRSARPGGSNVAGTAADAPVACRKKSACSPDSRRAEVESRRPTAGRRRSARPRGDTRATAGNTPAARAPARASPRRRSPWQPCAPGAGCCRSRSGSVLRPASVRARREDHGRERRDGRPEPGEASARGHRLHHEEQQQGRCPRSRAPLERRRDASRPLTAGASARSRRQRASSAAARKRVTCAAAGIETRHRPARRAIGAVGAPEHFQQRRRERHAGRRSPRPTVRRRAARAPA